MVEGEAGSAVVRWSKLISGRHSTHKKTPLYGGVLVLVSFLCHRRLAYQDDGQYRTQESGNLGRRAIYVLVDLCVTCVERHVGLVHRHWV